MINKDSTDTPSEKEQNSSSEDLSSSEISSSEVSSLEVSTETSNIVGVIQGQVRSIHRELGYLLVQVDHGLEGQISIEEFMEEGELLVSEGDMVEVYAESTGAEDTDFVLSKIKVAQQKKWDLLSIAYKNKQHLQGVITAKVKGGLSVDLDGVKAFLPASQVDLRPPRDLEQLVTQQVSYEFQIIKFNRDRGNLVLSRRVILEQARELLKRETLAKLVEGQLLKGTVKRITKYGAFVDIGGIDGLLHISDMSWDQISHPSEVLGQNAEDTELEVKLLQLDLKNERIKLGLKQITEDPWAHIQQRYEPHQEVDGRVINFSNHGVLIELESGVNGFLATKDLIRTTGSMTPQDLLSKDKMIKVYLIKIDKSNRVINLEYRYLESLWAEVETKYPVSTILRCSINRIKDDRLSVSITPEINGLIYAHDLSWTPDDLLISEQYKVGDLVDAVVLKVDVKGQEFLLGVKQLMTTQK